MQKKDNIRAKRLNQNVEREVSQKKSEENNYQKLKDRQSHSLQLHDKGAKMTIHSSGSPVDLVSQHYQKTLRGQQQERYDIEKQIDQKVRAHKLQTMGTSGYNIINGQRHLSVEDMVPSDNYGIFQSKLSHYYERFRIKPEDN